jgi:hypothetical protein
MATSIRQQIVTKADTLFKTILTANGYETNLGSHVFAWRDTAFSDAEILGMRYRDTAEEITPHAMGTEMHRLTIEAEIADLGSSAPENVRKAAADLEKALQTKLTWDSLALHTTFEASEMNVEQAENISAALKLEITIFFITPMGNPYASA